MTTAEKPTRTELLFVVAVALALFFFVLPAYMDWAASDMLRGAQPQHVDAVAQLQCPQPSEHESLVIFVNAETDGRVRMDCHLVGARGAYTRGRGR